MGTPEFALPTLKALAEKENKNKDKTETKKISDQNKKNTNKKTKDTIVVLGSGPIRIGQGIEFDYCSVHGVWALKKLGYETIIVNNKGHISQQPSQRCYKKSHIKQIPTNPCFFY